MSANVEEIARASARSSLTRLSVREPKMFSELVVAWLVRRLSLTALADLIEELDRALPEQPPRWTNTGSQAGYEDPS